MNITITEIENNMKVINDIAYKLDTETKGKYDSVIVSNIEDIPTTFTILPDSDSPMEVNIGEFVYIGGGAIKVLTKEDVEKIQKIG